MGLIELFEATLVVGVSAINAGLPSAAWRRSRDGRFVLVGLAHVALGALGAIWIWGALPFGAPRWAAGAEWPELAVVAAALLFLGSSLWPRRV